MTYYNGMTIDEIADQSMSEHSRFDEEHCRVCSDCYADRLDFMQEQADEARLDALAEAEEASDER